MASTKEIKDGEINIKTNLFIISLAKFAVKVHNQRQSDNLTYGKVVKATIEQVVEGTVYDITIEASNELVGVQQLYEAKVWFNRSTFYKELLEFKHAVEINEDHDYIIYLAKFAVQTYNQWQNAHLEFKKVVEETAAPAGAGVNYNITLEAIDDNGVRQLYQANVWVNETTGDDKDLLEFNLVEEHHDIDNIIIDLAQFAVQVYNQQQDGHLEFKSIVRAKIEPLVEGVIYHITLKVSNIEGIEQVYEAKVWVKESTSYKELLAFEHVIVTKSN